MNVVGTSHFKSLKCALNYYAPYGFDRRDVERKARDGEITIGPPEVKPGQELETREGGRYFIVEP